MTEDNLQGETHLRSTGQGSPVQKADLFNANVRICIGENIAIEQHKSIYEFTINDKGQYHYELTIRLDKYQSDGWLIKDKDMHPDDVSSENEGSANEEKDELDMVSQAGSRGSLVDCLIGDIDTFLAKVEDGVIYYLCIVVCGKRKTYERGDSGHLMLLL
eukprot:scaffold66238_cov43-Cyclotella_meneghiniana.AAC.9